MVTEHNKQTNKVFPKLVAQRIDDKTLTRSKLLAERNQSYSNGKLLISGEYVVLDGAKALAVPTQYGQSLKISKQHSNLLHWSSIDEHNKLWFSAEFEIINDDLTIIKQSNADISKRLLKILKATKQLNPEFLKQLKGTHIKAKLNFNRFWGLGSSSTLINNLALFAKVNPYELLQLTFGGSGYDIACANSKSALIFQLIGNTPKITPDVFNPTFKDKLYFVYLNKKQNSRKAISHYRTTSKNNANIIAEINAITESLINCASLKHFCELINLHEQIISKLIKQQPIKTLAFNDFNGCIKSLGAWGGDFILVASIKNPTSYFNSKGFKTVIAFKDMVI